MDKRSKINLLVLLILALTLLGCGIEGLQGLVDNAKTLSELGLRQVESAVIPVGKGDATTPDLLIVNRKLDPPAMTCYLSYAHKVEERWEVSWEHDLGSDVIGYTDVTAVADVDRVYVIVGSTLQALSLSDGAVEWEASLSDEVATTCRECAALAKDRLIVLTADLVLQGIDLAGGEVAWSHELNTATNWQVAPVVLGGGDRVAIVDQTAADNAAPAGLYVLDAASGEQLEKIVPRCQEIPLRINGPAFIDRAGENAYFALSLNVKHCVQAWSIEQGTVLWESIVPKEISGGAMFFDSPRLDSPGLLTDDVLYFGAGSTGKSGRLVAIDLADGAIELLFEDNKYAIAPRWQADGVLVVQANRTKGSEQHELWGVDTSTGETVWRYELQGTKPMGWGSSNFGSGSWTLAPARDGLAVIQVISEGGDTTLEYAVVDILNVQEGTIAAGTKTLLNDKHWMGTAWTRDRAYLSIRNLYSVDLDTGAVDWEWPLSEPPQELVDLSAQ